MRSSNPVLNSKTFGTIDPNAEPMTINGTVNKTALLLVLTMITGAITWGMVFRPEFAVGGADAANPLAMPFMIGGAIVGFILALIIIFKKTTAPMLAPLYAMAEGLFLGGISAFYEMQFPGIVIQAVTLTFGTLFTLLMAYRSGVIKATENFKLGVVAATGAIFIVYLLSFVLNMFNIGGLGFIHDSGPLGIGFSLVVVVIAALNLVLDFDFIETGAEAGAPKYMEWYGAFGLMVTLVWLYLEILRLLSKLRK
ncbi:MAG: Bax inhibitor-1/YccA family protein [Alcanivoracaceae bacterium]|nr:Bax inhibitor-1/YccA family protein [Alcanivoracaceae bacterium]